MSEKDNHNEEKTEGAFEIMEGLMAQLNSTKKMFLALILTIIILPAIAMVIVVATFGLPMEGFEDGKGPQFGPGKGPQLPGLIIFIATIVWLGIGIRKWFVISKWGKKYEKFKQKQAELERKFDEEDKNKDI